MMAVSSGGRQCWLCDGDDGQELIGLPLIFIAAHPQHPQHCNSGKKKCRVLTLGSSLRCSVKSAHIKSRQPESQIIYLRQRSASLNKLSILAPDYEGKIKMEWIARLAKMGASDELSDQQSRQLLFDLDSSYNSFMSALPNAGT